MSDETEDPTPPEKPPKEKGRWKRFFQPNLKTVVIGGPLLAAAGGMIGREILDSKREEARTAFMDALSRGDEKGILQAMGRHDFQSLGIEEFSGEALYQALTGFTSETERLQLVKDLLAKNTHQKNPDYSKALWAAVEFERNIEIVKALLEAGADPNAKDEDGYPLLPICNDPAVVQLLIKHGVDQVGLDRALWAAVECRDIEITKILLEAGADPQAKNENEHLLALCKDPAIIKLLLERGLDPNAVLDAAFGKYTPFHVAVDHRSSAVDQDPQEACEIVTLMLKHGADVHVKDGDGRTPLHCCEHVEVAKLLVAAGADVHAKDGSLRTPLHWSHNAAMAEYLLEQGADPNAPDWKGNTPLHYTPTDHNMGHRMRDVETTKVLLKHGANPNALNHNGENSLFDMSKPYDTLELIKLLLAAGADPKVKDKSSGKTPLHDISRIHRGGDSYYGVTYKEMLEVIKLLVQASADINARDNDGDTPLHAADNIETMKALLEAGADPTIKNNAGKTAVDDINDYIQAHKDLHKTTRKELEDTKAMLEEAIEKWNAEQSKASQAEKVEARRAGREQGAAPER